MITRQLKTMMAVLAGILLILMMAACTPVEPTTDEGATAPTEIPAEESVPTVQPNISDITWSLVHTIVGGDAVVPAPDFANVFFQIKDGLISGNSGCNRFSGSVTIEGNSISFGPLAATKMACDEATMTLEATVLDILNNAVTYSVTDNTLELQNADGLPLALFAAAEEKVLFVGPEQVDCESVAPQQCLLVREDPNDEYTFFYDTIAGFDWEAGYEYELLVNVTETTEPLADLTSLQYGLIEVVSKTAVTVEPRLVDTVWQWIRFDDAAGTNGIDVADPASYTLQFMVDSTYAIQADCNSGGGSYTVDGSSITIQPGPMTLAACGEDSLDGSFLAKLGNVITFVYDNEGNLVLNLKLDSGNMVFSPTGAQ